ncbi:MAG: hypothetical protein ACAH80_06540 [Alphaproteobacteria bacterium]
MRHFITIAASLLLLAAAPAQAQMKHDEITENPTCAPVFKVCPDGTWMSPIGAKCEIPPCGGYKPPADPYAPPPGATGHYVMPVRPKGDQSAAPVAPVNTCNNEVFTCADGTQVTRVPPMCNFARCPDVGEETEETPAEETEESQEENPDEAPAQ